MPAAAPPKNRQATSSVTTTDIREAAHLANTHALTELRIDFTVEFFKVPGPIPSDMSLRPLTTTTEVNVVGKLQDGGDVAFSFNAARIDDQVRGLEMVEALIRALDQITSFKWTTRLDFGPLGCQRLGPALRSLETMLPADTRILAQFAPLGTAGE
jgi:hypothetical protein